MCSLEIKFRLRQLTGGFLKIDKIASTIILQILTELESRNIGSLAFFNNSNLINDYSNIFFILDKDSLSSFFILNSKMKS